MIIISLHNVISSDIFKASQLSPEQLSEQLTALTTGQGKLTPQVVKSL